MNMELNRKRNEEKLDAIGKTAHLNELILNEDMLKAKTICVHCQLDMANTPLSMLLNDGIFRFALVCNVIHYIPNRFVNSLSA